MWYLIASYNGKVYNLGAGLNQACCAQMMTVYSNNYDNIKVKLSIARGYIHNNNLARKWLSQPEFVLQYKRDHFVVAQIENYDVSVRYEC